MTAAAQQVLYASNLRKVWADGVRHIDILVVELTRYAGDYLAVTGPSGSGKSTVLDILSLVLRPTKGATLMIDDGKGLRDVTPLLLAQDETALAQLRARVFGYIVQTSELIPFLTVRENCIMQQSISGRGGLDELSSLAKALDVDGLYDAFPADISVGQRQRVAVVRALCGTPRIVLADEPTAAQDPQLKDSVIDLLRMATTRGTAVIMVTHDVDLVARHNLTEIRNAGSVNGNSWVSRFHDTRIAS